MAAVMFDQGAAERQRIEDMKLALEKGTEAAPDIWRAPAPLDVFGAIGIDGAIRDELEAVDGARIHRAEELQELAARKEDKPARNEAADKAMIGVGVVATVGLFKSAEEYSRWFREYHTPTIAEPVPEVSEASVAQLAPVVSVNFGAEAAA